MQKNKIFSEKSWDILCYCCIVSCLIALCFLFIPVHDDLLGGYLLKSAFWKSLTFGNGRFLGNFFGMFLLHPSKSFLDGIVRVCFLLLLFFGISKQIKNHKNCPYLLLLLGFLSMGNFFWAEAISWGSAFYNYIPPVALFFLLWYLLSEQHPRLSRCIVVCLIAFFATLFSENSTVILFVFSFCFLYFAWRQKHSICLPIIAFCSCFVGSIVMFFFPRIFLGASEKMSNYRGLILGEGFFEKLLQNIITICEIAASAWILFLLYSCIFLWRIKTQKKEKTTWSVLTQLALLISPFCMFFAALFQENRLQSVRYFAYILSILGVALTLCGACYVIITHFTPEEKKRYLPFWGLAALSVAVMVPLDPIGPRTFVFTYFFLLLPVVDLFPNEVRPRMKHFLQLICLFFSFSLLWIYTCSFAVNTARDEWAEEQLSEGKTEIELIALPYAEWLHCANSSYAFEYKYYLQKPGDVSFVIITYEEYLSRKEANGV